MLRNSNYYYKTYDILDEGFHDRFRYNIFNPFGYTIESNSKKYKDYDKECYKSKDNYLGSHTFMNKK